MKPGRPKGSFGPNHYRAIELAKRDLTVAEIALQLGRSRNTVYGYLHDGGQGYRRPGRPIRACLDASALLGLIERRVAEYRADTGGGLRGLCQTRNLPYRTVLRIKASGLVSEVMLDELANRLGVPTVCIYPYEQMSLEVSA